MQIAKISKIDAYNLKTGKVKRVITTGAGVKLQVWPESWNPDWKEGSEVQIEDGWVSQGEYNGEIQYTLNVPKEKQVAPITLERIYEEIKRLAESVTVLSNLAAVKKIEESLKPQHQELRVEDINF